MRLRCLSARATGLRAGRTLAVIVAHAAWILPVPLTASEFTRPTIELSGDWEFRVDPHDVGRAEKWYDPATAFDQHVHVPGAWNADGIEYPTRELLEANDQPPMSGPEIIWGPRRESEKMGHVFPGPGWYRKTIEVPAAWQGKQIWLTFEGIHREGEAWINGRPAGEHISYLTPFRIDLSRFVQAGERATIVVRVDARRRKEVDPLTGCLDTADFVFVRWGGLYKRVFVEAVAPFHLADVHVIPQATKGRVDCKLTFGGANPPDARVVAEVVDREGLAVASAEAEAAKGASLSLSLEVPDVRLWSPRSPYLYLLKVALFRGPELRDARQVRFGMRDFEVVGNEFRLNGKPVFLRGYGEDCIFPNTIAPSTDPAELRLRLAQGKSYGFNYVRHHSWCPPQAYMEIADELGMMLQPEFPIAYRWQLPTTPEAKASVLRQWEQMIRLHRNHPSIVAWCMGNELYDSFDLAPEMYRIAKSLDPTRPVIDSDGFNFERNVDRPTLDYVVAQFAESESIGFGDGKYEIPAEVAKPVIAHEVGYFVTLPDLAQEKKIVGDGLKPFWLTATRDLARQREAADRYPAWLAASYKLHAVCLKTNLEAARRSKLSGTSVWLLQDYPNCAEGVLDMFLQPKSLSAEEFRRFNAPTVLLCDLPRRNWRAGERITATVLASRYEDEATNDARLTWRLSAGQSVVASGDVADLRVDARGVQELSRVVAVAPAVDGVTPLTFSARLEDVNGTVENSWTLWAYPPATSKMAAVRVQDGEAAPTLRKGLKLDGAASLAEAPDRETLYVAANWNASVIDALAGGERVLLLDPSGVFDVERTNFRLSSWDGGGPSGTMIRREHPAIAAMACDDWCDLQFYYLIQKSTTAFVDQLGVPIDPIVRCIDRPTRLRDRAYLFETGVDRGKLLVSGFNVVGALKQDDPGGEFLLRELVRYAQGPQFNPSNNIPLEALRKRSDRTSAGNP